MCRPRLQCTPSASCTALEGQGVDRGGSGQKGSEDDPRTSEIVDDGDSRATGVACDRWTSRRTPPVERGVEVGAAVAGGGGIHDAETIIGNAPKIVVVDADVAIGRDAGEVAQVGDAYAAGIVAEIVFLHVDVGVRSSKSQSRMAAGAGNGGRVLGEIIAPKVLPETPKMKAPMYCRGRCFW